MEVNFSSLVEEMQKIAVDDKLKRPATIVGVGAATGGLGYGGAKTVENRLYARAGEAMEPAVNRYDAKLAPLDKWRRKAEGKLEQAERRAGKGVWNFNLSDAEHKAQDFRRSTLSRGESNLSKRYLTRKENLSKKIVGPVLKSYELAGKIGKRALPIGLGLGVLGAGATYLATRDKK